MLPMLSLEQCRKVLGNGAPPADEDLERIRRDLYALAHVAVSAFGSHHTVDRPRNRRSTSRSQQLLGHPLTAITRVYS